MQKRWTALALAVLMLLPSGCGRRAQPEETPESSQSAAVPPEDISEQLEDPEPVKQPPTWEEGRTLEDMPDDYDGLELPVQGATGYISVEQPLWASIEDSEAAALAVEEWEKAEAERLLREQQALEQQQALEEQQAQQTPEGTQTTSEPSDETSSSSEESQRSDAYSAQVPETVPADVSSPGEQEGADQAGIPTQSEPSPVQGEGGTGPEPDVSLPNPSESAPADTSSPAESSDSPAAPEASSPPPAAADPEVPKEEPEPPTLTDGSLTLLPPSTPFTILQEEGNWWKIAVEADYYEDDEKTILRHGELTGWVEHTYCFINLPDVIPSIIYDATNSYSSHFVSCGKRIPQVTGEAFYPSKTYNARLNKMEFMMPVLYSMAHRLCAAQQNALSEGNSLILYEGYRPHTVQTKVLNALSAMARTDPEVKEAVAGDPWQISWFISGGYSNHQRGYAVDVGLAKVTATKEYTTGGLRYVRVWNYERYEMPTPIHELSRAAATFTAPVAINSTTAWKHAELSAAMNAPALGLQRYCTDAELTPLASEWWHFNDLTARSQVLQNQGIGNFIISSNRSVAPS